MCKRNIFLFLFNKLNAVAYFKSNSECTGSRAIACVDLLVVGVVLGRPAPNWCSCSDHSRGAGTASKNLRPRTTKLIKKEKHNVRTAIQIILLRILFILRSRAAAGASSHRLLAEACS
jgi:hypothetical protein